MTTTTITMTAAELNAHLDTAVTGYARSMLLGCGDGSINLMLDDIRWLAAPLGITVTSRWIFDRAQALPGGDWIRSMRSRSNV